MRYIIEVRSQEDKSFGLLLQIDAEATFLQLHEVIVGACEYDTSQLASFFTVADNGQRLQEISLLELSSEDTELNEAVMDVATLNEFIGKNIKKLEYQFDFFGDRYFTLAIKEVQKGAQQQPFILQQIGVAPPQLSLEGFEGIDLLPKSEGADIDYEKYLSSFEDCSDNGNIDYESLENWDDEEFN